MYGKRGFLLFPVAFLVIALIVVGLGGFAAANNFTKQNRPRKFDFVRLNSSGQSVVNNVTIPSFPSSTPSPYINRCDFNYDGKVDQADVDIAAKGFGSVTPGSNNLIFDLNKDNKVNSIDLMLIASKNSKYCF